MKNKILTILCCMGFIGFLIALIWGTVLAFQNPDMTDMRFVIEYPVPTILMFVSAIILGIAKEI